uniref:Small ribosomal subunit protein uS8c n=1 Tax=Pedobesia claviformis TaxID=2364088 RepID=A0A386B0T4_9CHLO|nr:ribosomal protein S8 [Pedobesia claviformis]AYC65312.1 ribosomal protein S8 [Pedobesia claviformis]
MDTISQTITHIRNANLTRNSNLILSANKINYQLIKLLKYEGFIDDFKLQTNSVLVCLKYNSVTCKPIITNLKRLSCPGRRIYMKSSELPQLFGGLGILILSTSRGILTDKQARKFGVGGEVLCAVW